MGFGQRQSRSRAQALRSSLVRFRQSARVRVGLTFHLARYDELAPLFSNFHDPSEVPTRRDLYDCGSVCGVCGIVSVLSVRNRMTAAGFAVELMTGEEVGFAVWCLALHLQ